MNQFSWTRRRLFLVGPRSGAIAGILLIAAACGGDGSSPAAPAFPEHITAAIKDPRIGSGIPAPFRFVGAEHNRLSLVTLRDLRSESRGYRDEAIRCAGILRVGHAQAPRTAAAAGVPEHASVVRAAIAAAMADLPGCVQFGGRRTAAITADTGIRIFGDDTTRVSDEAFATMNAFVDGLDAATSFEDVWARIDQLATLGYAVGGADGDAILALVSQAQGSYVLWEPGGAGWTELGAPGEYQSVFGPVFQRNGLDQFIGIMKADAIGCLAGIGFLRALPIVHDARLLMAGCGAAAAGSTVYAAYKSFFAEK